MGTMDVTTRSFSFNAPTTRYDSSSSPNTTTLTKKNSSPSPRDERVQDGKPPLFDATVTSVDSANDPDSKRTTGKPSGVTGTTTAPSPSRGDDGNELPVTRADADACASALALLGKRRPYVSSATYTSWSSPSNGTGGALVARTKNIGSTSRAKSADVGFVPNKRARAASENGRPVDFTLDPPPQRRRRSLSVHVAVGRRRRRRRSISTSMKTDGSARTPIVSRAIATNPHVVKPPQPSTASTALDVKHVPAKVSLPRSLARLRNANVAVASVPSEASSSSSAAAAAAAVAATSGPTSLLPSRSSPPEQSHTTATTTATTVTSAPSQQRDVVQTAPRQAHTQSQQLVQQQQHQQQQLQQQLHQQQLQQQQQQQHRALLSAQYQVPAQQHFQHQQQQQHQQLQLHQLQQLQHLQLQQQQQQQQAYHLHHQLQQHHYQSQPHQLTHQHQLPPVTSPGVVQLVSEQQRQLQLLQEQQRQVLEQIEMSQAAIFPYGAYPSSDLSGGGNGGGAMQLAHHPHLAHYAQPQPHHPHLSHLVHQPQHQPHLVVHQPHDARRAMYSSATASVAAAQPSAVHHSHQPTAAPVSMPSTRTTVPTSGQTQTQTQTQTRKSPVSRSSPPSSAESSKPERPRSLARYARERTLSDLAAPRRSLPNNAKQLLKEWLFDHEHHPYPSSDEKDHFMMVTGLTLTQINNWFSNARRRFLPRNAANTGGKPKRRRVN